MPFDSNTTRLLTKIAHAFYEDGLSQKQIGVRFGLSRIKVSRMLKQARELKVVQIIISSDNKPNERLEKDLEVQFGIDEAIVVSSEEDHDEKATLRALGAAAAECLVRSIQGDEIVAVTWGRTVLAVVDSLPAENWPNVRVLQSLGALSQPDSKINAVDLARRIAQAFGAKPLLLSSPGIVESRTVRESLLHDPQIGNTLSLAAKADIALVGIGLPNSTSSLSQFGILKDEDLARLTAKGTVGDIGLQFFNAKGEKIRDEIHDKVVGLELAQYKAIPRVIAVACGDEKSDAIRAALKTKIINVLVTDDRTAVRLLSK